MFGGLEAVDSLHKQIDHYSSSTEQGRQYWMLMPEIGYIIFNFYNVVLVYMMYSPTYTSFLKFLPQHSSSPPQSGQIAKFRMISLMLSRPKEHFMYVKLASFTLLSPTTTFSIHFNEPNTVGWEYLVHVGTGALKDILRRGLLQMTRLKNFSDSE